MGARPPAGSCRAGAPVMLFTAQNASLPATLEVTTHEEGEELTYLVKVCGARRTGGGGRPQADPFRGMQTVDRHSGS